MCKKKEKGGLGFRDIGMFNQVILGKQACHIWDKPSSLLARILRSRYFKNGRFWIVGSALDLLWMVQHYTWTGAVGERPHEIYRIW